MLFARQLRDTRPAQPLQRCPSPVTSNADATQGDCQQLTLLRSTYLDSEAVEAGAEGTELYRDEQLVRREACRDDAAVKAALAVAWAACTQGEAVLRKPGFMSMARRIYLALLLDPTEAGSKHRVSAVDCMESAEKDWQRDANGKDHLTRDDFERSFFQLADLHTQGVDAAQYAAFILSLTDKIARVRLIGGQPIGWEFRDDRAIFAEASARAHALPRQSKKLRKPSAALIKKDDGAHATAARPSPDGTGANVWVRLMWLSAMDGARKVEQDMEKERASEEHAKQRVCEPYQLPQRFAIPASTSVAAAALDVGRSGRRRSAHEALQRGMQPKLPGAHASPSHPSAQGSAYTPPRACSLPHTPSASRAMSPRAREATIKATVPTCSRAALAPPQGSLFASRERAREVVAEPQASPLIPSGISSLRPHLLLPLLHTNGAVPRPQAVEAKLHNAAAAAAAVAPSPKRLPPLIVPPRSPDSVLAPPCEDKSLRQRDR